MYAKTLLLFPLALVFLHPAAHADFRIQPSLPSSNIPVAVSASPPSRPRFLVARGFGRQVPMSFAIRQIVPHTTVVRFGPAVDSAAPVNWSGGRPWNRVLAAALRPLRLRMTTAAGSVTISH
jgi:hypothetical protein